MKRTSWVGLFILVVAFPGLLPFAWAQPEARKYLLRGTQGEIPSDAGDEATKATVGDNKELGGKCIKVDLRNSIGVSKSNITDWKPYTALAFDMAVEKDLTLIFTIRHAKTKDFANRVDREFQLKAGKNTIRFPIDTLVNNDKSAPDLENIVRWYIALDEEKDKAALIYLGDVWLEGGPVVAVDPNLVKSDPARLARIKANKMPAINQPVMFNTPEADAICSALEVFPANNPWNLIVEDWPLHPSSKDIINSMGADKPLRYNPDMGFILVPPNQKKIDVNITEYAEESDKGPYPVPSNVPIEGWPAAFRELPKGEQPTLDDIQRDKKNEGGDRHAIVLDPARRLLYEFYVMKKTDKGWSAEGAAIFDLKSNKLRPDGWTSADAAGLPIFPAVVRYDELKRGVIEHALRVTVAKSRKAYVYPATHYASKLTDENLPRMGERLRLKKDVDVSKFSPEVQTILKALKRYGMLVADNGIDWAISVTPDPRIKALHEELRRLKGSDFEVIVAPPGYEPATDDKKPADDKPASEPAPNSEPSSKVEHPVIKADLYVDSGNKGPGRHSTASVQDGAARH
ncbi:MAG: hypothetical protein QM703_29450 [Gemmatales bacterium]